MPFPRNWLEELIAEYVQLEEYCVETGHPVQTGKKGGRLELDILGVKTDGKIPCLWHIEAGRARSKKERADKIQNQLLDPCIDEELNRLFGTAKRKKWFVSEDIKESSGTWQELKKDFAGKVTLITFEELMRKIEEAIKQWKKRHVTEEGNPPTLPGNLWLLKMLDRMNETRKQ